MEHNRCCPICFEIPEHEIYQCSAGHIICNVCIASLSICPQCRAPFGETKIRNRVLEEILDGQEFECRFKQEGCEHTSKRADISSHAKTCTFSLELVSLCEMIGYENCKFKFGSSSKTREEILNHFKIEHGCSMADYGNIKILLDTEELSGNVPMFLRPVIISQPHATSDLLLLIGKINSPTGFISEICIQIWGQVEPIKNRYEATFSIAKRPSFSGRGSNGMAERGRSNGLKQDPLQLQWTLNVYTIEEAKYVLKTSPINIPLPFLADCLISPSDDIFVEVKIVPSIPSSTVDPTINFYS